MILEARAASCLSSTFILKLDDRPIGKFQGRWFSESLDIDLTGRFHLQLQKVGWLGSQFVLKELDHEEPIADAKRSGVFSSNWDLELSFGPVQLVRANWFSPEYVVQQEGTQLARATRIGWGERGWRVDSNTKLKNTDLILCRLV